MQCNEPKPLSTEAFHKRKRCFRGESIISLPIFAQSMFKYHKKKPKVAFSEHCTLSECYYTFKILNACSNQLDSIELALIPGNSINAQHFDLFLVIICIIFRNIPAIYFLVPIYLILFWSSVFIICIYHMSSISSITCPQSLLADYHLKETNNWVLFGSG